MFFHYGQQCSHFLREKKNQEHIYFIFIFSHFSQELTFYHRPFNDWNPLILSWRKVLLKTKWGLLIKIPPGQNGLEKTRTFSGAVLTK